MSILPCHYSYRTYCIIGDGESAEGSIWEALHFASVYKLDNLVAIFDVNRLGQSAETSLGHDVEVYRKRLEAFGSVPLSNQPSPLPLTAATGINSPCFQMLHCSL